MTDQDPTSTESGRPRKSTNGHGGHRNGAGARVGQPNAKGQPTTAQSYELLAKARAKRETYRAQMAEIEYRTRIGELLEASVVAETWSHQVLIAKGRLLAIPTRLAPVLVAMGDMREIEKTIRDEIYQALTELSADPEETQP